VKATLVSEHLALKETCGHGRAVHLDEIPCSAWAQFVNGSRDDFLASPSFAGDQHGGIGGCNGAHLGEDFSQTFVETHDVLQKRDWREFKSSLKSMDAPDKSACLWSRLPHICQRV